jgi:ABC-type transport system involved in cytochrome c biogenesis ATPase subunit
LEFSFAAVVGVAADCCLLELLLIPTDIYNSFIIFCRLPVPRPGKVLGLVGTNGIGKSTALQILAGVFKPNLGKFTVSDSELCLLSLAVQLTIYY